jgi:hypothetical protein
MLPSVAATAQHQQVPQGIVVLVGTAACSIFVVHGQLLFSAAAFAGVSGPHERGFTISGECRQLAGYLTLGQIRFVVLEVPLAFLSSHPVGVRFSVCPHIATAALAASRVREIGLFADDASGVNFVPHDRLREGGKYFLYLTRNYQKEKSSVSTALAVYAFRLVVEPSGASFPAWLQIVSRRRVPCN